MEMIDMVGDMKDLMQAYQQIKQNPRAFLSRRFNIPQNFDLSNPNNVVQYLLNTNQITQEQVNQGMQRGRMVK